MKIIPLNAGSIDESELLTGLTNGDVAAFATIYKLFSSDLYRYARKNITTPEDCEEIVQDIFESLWNRRFELRIKSISSYLFSSVRYKVIRYYQRSEIKRKYEEHYRFFEILYENSDDLQVTPIEASVIIQRCIDDLPKRYQDVVKLRVFNELSNAEIAERLKLTPQTVEIYISNALKGLRNSYKTRFGDAL